MRHQSRLEENVEVAIAILNKLADDYVTFQSAGFGDRTLATLQFQYRGALREVAAATIDRHHYLFLQAVERVDKLLAHDESEELVKAALEHVEAERARVGGPRVEDILPTQPSRRLPLQEMADEDRDSVVA